MDRSTGGVLDHHLQAFAAADVAGILADYTDESAVVTPDGRVLRGPDEIAPLFQAFFAEFAQRGASFAMGQRVIVGEIAFITWSAETAVNIYELGTDTFLVRDGKILTQTFAAKVQPKR